ncbi:MAG: DUF3137 domain-containing protein, partial [Flavobacteriales bacterium]|nr:DUF3137 domain-containing protein [Flavobacteriales bacterium]
MRDVDAIIAQLNPKLVGLEADRLAAYHYSKKWLWIGVGIAILGIGGFFIHPILGGGLVIIGLAVAIAPYQVKRSKYQRSFKSEIVPLLARAVCPEVEFVSDGHVGEDEFVSSRLFISKPDKYSGEDFFSGRIGSTSIRFSEVHAQEIHRTTDSKGNVKERYETIFRGLFFITEFHKHFQGETYVLPDFSESWMGRIGRKLQKWNFNRPDLVELESPEFEKHFVVYSTDQIESRYLVTPNMMERILDLKKKFDCRVHLSFLNEK